jgi:mono/diheme cytochrome c family protein
MSLVGAVIASTQLAVAAGAVDAAPAWVVDPTHPGPDAPAVGASLFDEITRTETGARTVPFPFPKLLEHVAAAAGCTSTDACVKSVLVPLGRSLQRVAATPDFFAYPRVVSAVTGDGSRLRDRVYIGYQERSGLLEVISYNEAAGRFEFQIVKNYREGVQPQVFQARRDVCIACHQNHAPIFPRQVWDETNANPAVIGRMLEYHRVYQSVAVRGSADISNAIDDATDRANRIALTNTLWRDGCGAGEAGVECRASALIAAAQFVLTHERAYDHGARFQTQVAATLQRSAQRLWASGLAVPSPDIPNRDPLAREASGLALSHVPAAFEALAPRAPLEVLRPDGTELAAVLVKGIAESLGREDATRAREALEASKQRARRTYEGRCKLERSAQRVRFDCQSPVTLQGSIDGSGGSIDILRIGDQEPVRYLQATAILQRADTMAFAPRTHGVTARLPSGDAIERITLHSLSAGDARVEISVAEDFVPLRDALSQTLKDRRQEWPAIAFRQTLAKLSAQAAKGCCAPRISASTRVEPVATPSAARELTAPFQSQCGACHQTADASPPNFLSGDAARVRRALASCAPRIYVRLAMNELHPSERDKTPMPPEFPTAAVNEQAPRPLRGDLLALRKRIEKVLQQQYQRVPTVGELLAAGYEALPPCLPDDAPDPTPSLRAGYAAR